MEIYTGKEFCQRLKIQRREIPCNNIENFPRYFGYKI